MKLEAKNLPPGVASILGLAEKWGIGDDCEREAKICEATRADLVELTSCYGAIDVDALFMWLAGPEADSPSPSEEYLAFTCLTMAIDSARLRLKKQTS